MAEDAQEQEKQTIIPTLFPVGKQSVLSAFSDLSLTENLVGANKAANEEETRILRETNPHVLTSFEELLESYVKDDAAQMRLGNLICHRALRKEAKFQGGVLPTFTEQFVKDYSTEQDKRIEEEINDKQPLDIGEAARQQRRARVVMFRNKEPKFSKIVEEKLGGQANWRPEDDFRYTGIIYQYLLFRAGCKDPKNFQQ